MHTNGSLPTLKHSETRSISIAADPGAVLAFVSDPRNLPRWAPGFADAAEPGAGDIWQIRSGAAEFPVAAVVDQAAGTFDLLGTPERTSGAFTRVLPNGDGADYLFTLQFGPEADADAIAAQMAVVEGELRAVRELVEGATC